MTYRHLTDVVADRAAGPLTCHPVTAATRPDLRSTDPVERVDWHTATCYDCTPRYGHPFVEEPNRDSWMIRHLFEHPTHGVAVADDDQRLAGTFLRHPDSAGFGVVCAACLDTEVSASPGRALVWWRQHRATWCGTRDAVTA